MAVFDRCREMFLRVIDSAKSNDLSYIESRKRWAHPSSCHGIERPTKIERTGEVENQQGGYYR